MRNRISNDKIFENTKNYYSLHKIAADSNKVYQQKTSITDILSVQNHKVCFNLLRKLDY